MSRSPSQIFKGIIPPLITPLAGHDRLDFSGLERLIEHVLDGGVHGLFILGTSGEGPCLSYRLRRELISQTCQLVKGRVPVLVGVTDTSLVEAVAMAKHSAEAGADAVVSAAPYYFPAGQPELIQYIHQLVSQLSLPLFLYNMPEMTKTSFEPETVRQLLQLEGIIGIKDSSGNLNYFRQLIEIAKARPDWRVFIGPENLLVDALQMGGQGGVNGGAQIDPRLLVGIYDAVRSRDLERVDLLQQRLSQLDKIYRMGRHSSTVIKGMKCALSLMGLCNDEMAAPFSPFSAVEREKVRVVLEQLNIVLAAKSQPMAVRDDSRC